LLTLWSALSTTGKDPLYAQLFLTPGVLKSDPLFDHPLGKYLTYFDAGSGQYKPFAWNSNQPEDTKTGNVSLKNHLLAIQSALSLTTDEMARILADSGTPLEDAPLTMTTLSLLYRFATLAEGLKLTIREFIAVKELTGLDPFKALKTDPITAIADDYPFAQTLLFIEKVKRIKDSGFTIEDLEYLFRHQFDPTGKYRLDLDTVLALVKTLAVEIQRIQTEHAIPDDSVTLTDDLLREKLSLIFPPDVVETFLGMWTGTVEYEAVKSVPVGQKLNPEDFSNDPDVLQAHYDEVLGVQRFTYRGVLLDARKAELTAAHAEPLTSQLLNTIQTQAKEFFKNYFGKSQIGGRPMGFLEAGEFETLFAPIDKNLPESQKQEAKRTKLSTLTQAFFPYLQQRLIRQLVIQILATHFNDDTTLTSSLLTDINLLVDPSQTDKPLLDSFIDSGRRGVSVTFFDTTDGTGPSIKSIVSIPVASTGIKDPMTDQPIKPPETRSARFGAYLEVPTSGPYRFSAVLEKQGAEAKLSFSHLPNPLFQGKVANDGEEISEFVEMQAGILYRFELDARNLGTGNVSLLVQGENLPKGHLGRLTLYPTKAIERIQRVYVMLAKTLQIVRGLDLTEREVRHVLTHENDFDNVDLSKLPTRPEDATPDNAKQLFRQFLRLADYSRLKQQLAGRTDDLINTFEHARRIHPASSDANQAKTEILNDLYQRVAELTRRDVDVVKAAAEHLGFAAKDTLSGAVLNIEAPDFVHEKGLQRLWEVLQIVGSLGVSVEAVGRWMTPAPDFSITRNLRNTVKARYEEDIWLRMAQPIFDGLRQQKRDALVAFIMHQDGFDRIEHLFEYFLIDPGMEPVVQTSRLRLAISSVQLFIQRCLLNLEDAVHPSVINSKHWQWMKRYRVWEANRKIFLFPENWLEPEFRDDKTHLFQELESALLQGDVSNDLVEDTFFQYLKGLDELARLDIVTMYCEENPLDPADNTLHVIGRTFSLPHKYFYRRYAGQMWTPWEPVTAEIEGDHVVAVIWRERLHVFWVTFLEKAKENSEGQQGTNGNESLQEMTLSQIASGISAGFPKKEVEIQLNWCEYFQGEWTERESSGFGDPIRVEVPRSFESRKTLIHVSLEKEEGSTDVVYIHLAHDIQRAFKVVSKNSLPETVDAGYAQIPPYGRTGVQGTRYASSDSLVVIFLEQVRPGQVPGHAPLTSKVILRQSNRFLFTPCCNRVDTPTSELGKLINPFFYQDNHHTFLVEPTLTEKTFWEHEDYIPIPTIPEQEWEYDEWWDRIPIDPRWPFPDPPIPMDPFDPGWVDPIDPLVKHQMKIKTDWATDPTTVFRFDEQIIWKGGGLDSEILEMSIGQGDAGSIPNVTVEGEPVTRSGVLSLKSPQGRGGPHFTTYLNLIGHRGLDTISMANLNSLHNVADSDLATGLGQGTFISGPYNP